MAKRKDDWANEVALKIWLKDTPPLAAANMIRAAAKREWARKKRRGAQTPMNNELMRVGPNTCTYCGDDYGHKRSCQTLKNRGAK